MKAIGSIILAGILLAFATTGAKADYVLLRSTISTGAGHSSGGAISAVSTYGVSPAGRSSAGVWTLRSGPLLPTIDDASDVVADPLRPTIFAMYPASPNPFVRSTRIDFDLPASSPIRLNLYDVKGRHVKTLLPGAVFNSGRHSVEWLGMDDHGEQAGSGVYFCVIDAGDHQATQRLVLLH